MTIEDADQLLLFAISLGANIFSAFSGGGAGLIQLPALIFLGLPFGVALATHKVASVALGVGATLRHLREDALERRFMLFILGTGVPGVVLGASVILSVPDRSAEIALGLLTCSLGIYSLFKPQLGQEHAPRHRDLPGYLGGGLGLFVIGIGLPLYWLQEPSRQSNEKGNIQRKFIERGIEHTLVTIQVPHRTNRHSADVSVEAGGDQLVCRRNECGCQIARKSIKFACEVIAEAVPVLWQLLTNKAVSDCERPWVSRDPLVPFIIESRRFPRVEEELSAAPDALDEPTCKFLSSVFID